MKILALDPGNHTGWVAYDTNTKALMGGTIGETFLGVWKPLCKADVIVYETFNLYPGAAKHLTRNEFYPCQVIGVIRLFGEINKDVKLIKQSPSVKKFAGGLDEVWEKAKQTSELVGYTVSEHTKDAFLHLKYYLIQEGLNWQ